MPIEWLPTLSRLKPLLTLHWCRIGEVLIEPLKRNFKKWLSSCLQAETHNRRNINKSHADTFDAFEPVFEICASRDISVRAYVSTVWGCPYEGNVDPKTSAEIAHRLLEMGAYEISLERHDRCRESESNSTGSRCHWAANWSLTGRYAHA